MDINRLLLQSVLWGPRTVPEPTCDAVSFTFVLCLVRISPGTSICFGGDLQGGERAAPWQQPWKLQSSLLISSFWKTTGMSQITLLLDTELLC